MPRVPLFCVCFTHPSPPPSRPQRIWNEWQKQCLRVCDEDVKRYWICKEEQQLLTPINCRKESDAMKEALRECGRDEEAFAVYRARRVDEIEAAIMKRRAELAGGGGSGAAASSTA